MPLDDKTGADMIRTFLKQPVSTVNLVLILVAAVTWWNSREANVEKLMAAAKTQERRIEGVETKIDADEKADIKQNAEVVKAIHAIGNRLSVLEADTRWLVRQQGGPAARP